MGQIQLVEMLKDVERFWKFDNPDTSAGQIFHALGQFRSQRWAFEIRWWIEIYKQKPKCVWFGTDLNFLTHAHFGQRRHPPSEAFAFRVLKRQ